MARVMHSVRPRELGMDFVAYEFKRAHWSMYSTAMREIERVGGKEPAPGREEGEGPPPKRFVWKIPALEYMTPARYDIAHAIAERCWWTRKPGKRKCPKTEMPMRDLVQMLGLHPTTVSKAVARMRVLELVVTRRSTEDKRAVLISLTQAGWDALREVRKMFRVRPQHFLRRKLGQWFRRLGMKDAIGSMRTAQRWAKTLASTFGITSDPIHDPRCDLDYRESTRLLHELDIETLRWLPPPPNVRRRAYS